MYFPIHNYPFDYWRFTPEGSKSLMRPFSKIITRHAGPKNLPHTFIGIGFKGEWQNNWLEINETIDKWQSDWKNPIGKIAARVVKQAKISLYSFFAFFYPQILPANAKRSID